MSVYNTLVTKATCPCCGECHPVLADFRFGLRDQLEYRLGDRLIWEGRGVRTPSERPTNGNFSGEANTECPGCGCEFWLMIDIESDRIVRAVTDWEREDYPDRGR